MSRRQEKPVQFVLPVGGGTVNHCFFAREDELTEKKTADTTAARLEKVMAGKLSDRSLTRHRDELLREAIRTDRVEALARLMPKKRMTAESFSALFSFAEDFQCPDASAWLLAYRGANYRCEEFDALEQRRLELELGLAEPDERELRRLFRLRFGNGGVSICGVKARQHDYEIPARIGRKAVVCVDAAAFYALDPMPRVRRGFADAVSLPLPQNVQPDETIFFGHCPAKKGAVETPIPWRVLRREGKKVLAICERAVAVLPYHPELQEVTWESCALRRWLNTVFLPIAFTELERASILNAVVETLDNPYFCSSGGAPTEDRLFLLSTEEASSLLADDTARSLGCWWWLRSPGFDGSFAAAITPDGSVVRIGSFVDTDDYAVRPAMWIQLD